MTFDDRINLAFTSQIFWTNTLQYERTRAVMDLSSMFRWEIDPGNDLYAVVTQRWFEDPRRMALPAGPRTGWSETCVELNEMV